MRAFSSSFTRFAVYISLLIFFTGLQIQGQQDKPISFNDIQKTLVFRSRISKTTDELNEQLISEIRKRKVNFILSSEQEKSLKKAGGSDLLIKTIHEVLPEKLKVKFLLYQKYLDNYDREAFEKKKIALEAAKEYVKKYSDDKEDKEIIDYFREVITILEKLIGN